MVGDVLHLHKSKKTSSYAAYVITDVAPSPVEGRVIFSLGKQAGTRPAPEKWARRDWVYQESDPYASFVQDARDAETKERERLLKPIE
jgi:hypothetical protein